MESDASPDYWLEYSNLQHTKHALIREYLGGWFPKLGLWSRRIVYLDTHAGRGVHRAGQSGSPIVALNTLLTHSFRDRILGSSEVRFYFIEHDKANVGVLHEEIAALGKLPPRILVSASHGDCFAELEETLASMDAA